MTDAQPSEKEAARDPHSRIRRTPASPNESPEEAGKAISDDAVVMARLLWPEPVALTLSRGPADPAVRQLAEFLPLRLGERAPILLPITPRAAARAVRRRSQGLRARQRWTRWLLSIGLATGLAQRVFRERLRVSIGPEAANVPTFDKFLEELFGQPVLISISLGPLRANRKPVVQVLTTRGSTLAFVKVGWNTLTRSLGRKEAETLRRLERASVRTAVPPRLLYAGAWESLEVLAVSALHGRATVLRRSSSVPLVAMRDVSSVTPWVYGQLETAPFWHRLAAFRSSVLGAQGQSFSRMLHTLTLCLSGKALAFGSWHGDWTPWNMAWQRNGTVQLWDWERFETGVPVGFDALHYSVEAHSRRGGSLRSGVAHTRRHLPELLTAFDVAPDHDVLVLTLYLLELFRRWYTDSHEELGGQLLAKTAILLEIIDGLLLDVARVGTA